MKHRILLFALILMGMCSDMLAQQCITTVLSAGSPTTNARCPMTRYRNARSHYLITAAELAAAGYVAGNAVGGISWNYTTAPTVAGTGNLIVYLENTADVANNKSGSWNSAIVGMQMVHNAATSLPAAAGYFNVNFSGGSPFIYTGGALYVAFDWSYCAGTLDNTSQVGCNTALPGGLKGVQNPLACFNMNTLNSASSRPDTRLLNTVVNDVKVDYVYTMGEIPIGIAPNHIVQARILNRGTNSYTNYNVQLDISGANTFSDVFTISNLPACGAQTISFDPFTPTALGVDTVRVSLPPDTDSINNVLDALHTITEYSYHYRYLGEAPTTGVGFSGSTGAICAKFTTNTSITLTHVNVQFNSIGLPYKLAIYPANGGGGPSTTPIYIDANNRITNNGPATDVMLDNPVVVPAGNFFVSIHQVGNQNAAIIYAPEAPLRTNSLYFTSPLPVAVWVDMGPNNGAFRSLVGVKFCNLSTPDSISGPDVVCEGSTNTYSVAPEFGALSYNWTLPGGWTGSSTSNTITAVAGSSGGSISCMVTYSCGNAIPASLPVLVTPSSGVLATANSAHTQDHPDGYSIDYYNSNCDLIATLADPAGGNVPGITTATVNVDANASFHNGQPYVRRWYQLTPASNGSADVVLYVNQSDFDDYNSVVTAPYLPLPTSGNNADPNIANISITKNGDLGLGDSPIVINPVANWNGNYWELSFTSPGFSQFRIHSVNPGNVPLPASVLSFEGNASGKSDVLRWSTGSEQNCAMFLLQHSNDAIHFTTIAKVNSQAQNGNSSAQLNYTSTNKKPLPGHNYYRLQQVDIDGKVHSVARIIDLYREHDGNAVHIYPNPASDVLNADLYIRMSEQVAVKLFDMEGRLIRQVQAMANAGMNTLTMDMTGLASGLYNVQVFENETMVYSGKVRKK